MKEHLVRCHTAPHRCQRCLEIFKDADTLERHLKAAQACEVRQHEDQHILTPGQASLLKQRSKGRKSEEQKWKELYANLFPADKGSEIPSPYCNDDILGDFQGYIRRAFPSALSERLDLFRFEPQLKTLLVQAVGEVQERLFCDFQQLHCEAPSDTSNERSRAPSKAPSATSMKTPDSCADLDFVDVDTSDYIETWNDKTLESAPLSPLSEGPQSIFSPRKRAGASNGSLTHQAKHARKSSYGQAVSPSQQSVQAEQTVPKITRVSPEASTLNNLAGPPGSTQHAYAAFPYGTQPMHQIHPTSTSLTGNPNPGQSRPTPCVQHPTQGKYAPQVSFMPLGYPPAFFTNAEQRHYPQQYVDPFVLQGRLPPQAHLGPDCGGRSLPNNGATSVPEQLSDSPMMDLSCWTDFNDIVESTDDQTR